MSQLNPICINTLLAVITLISCTPAYGVSTVSELVKNSLIKYTGTGTGADSERIRYKNNLTRGKVQGYDEATTTHIAVKPSRHTSVIFMPDANGYYPVAPTGVNASHASYDGFGEPNTIAFTVNKFRPLCGVVASRHPMIFLYGDNLLTKHIGGLYHA